MRQLTKVFQKKGNQIQFWIAMVKICYNLLKCICHQVNEGLIFRTVQSSSYSTISRVNSTKSRNTFKNILQSNTCIIISMSNSFAYKSHRKNLKIGNGKKNNITSIFLEYEKGTLSHLWSDISRCKPCSSSC